MGWLLLAAAAVAVFVFAKKEQFRFDVYPIVSLEGQGTVYGFAGYKGNLLVYESPLSEPYATEAAANVAGAAWVAQMAAGVIVGPTPDPIDIPEPPPGPQGGGVPMMPYLSVSGGGVVGSAVVEGDEVRWSVGAESDVAESAITANATLLSRVDSRAVLGAPVTIVLRKSDGRTLRAAVSKVVGPAAPWAWSFASSAVQGGVGTSTSRPEWRAASRLAAMRGALSTLQDA